MTIVVGTMKNLPASLATVDAALFRQVLVQGDDPSLCPIHAIERQRVLVKDVESVHPEENWLFRRVFLNQRKLGPGQTTEEMFRGLAGWVSSCID